MSESRVVKMAILDKFKQFYAVLYQRRPKKMSENAERPARSGRGSGEKERPTTSSVRSGRGSGEKERPTASSVLFPAADRARRSGRPQRTITGISARHADQEKRRRMPAIYTTPAAGSNNPPAAAYQTGIRESVP